MTPAIALAALGGLLLGSFLNVVAHRLPARRVARHAALGAARAAARTVRPHDNVPVLSWLAAARRAAATAPTPISRALPARRGGDRRCCWRAVAAVHFGDTTAARPRPGARRASSCRWR